MTWQIGSGLGSFLKGIISNSSFQQAAIRVIQGIAQKGLEKINDPDALRKLFENMSAHPQAVVGAMVANTEAEPLVDKKVTDAVKEIRTP